MIVRLGHVCLGTPRLDEMVAFYCDHLGCRVVHEFVNDDGERYGAFLAVGDSGTFLEFFSDHDARAVPNAVFRHFCLQVRNVEAMAQCFRRLGQEPDVRRGRSDGVLQCWVEDPDGNRVEFHQYDEASVQWGALPEQERGTRS